uniref:Uncharacterized protein n=1 Tax=Arundo donax TaxID=35708 RepID=A0A0A9F9G7_ARUDO
MLHCWSICCAVVQIQQAVMLSPTKRGSGRRSAAGSTRRRGGRLAAGSTRRGSGGRQPGRRGGAASGTWRRGLRPRAAGEDGAARRKKMVRHGTGNHSPHKLMLLPSSQKVNNLEPHR